MSIAQNFTQGGQVTLHNIRMIRQVLNVTFWATITISIGFFLIKTLQDYTPYQRQIIRTYMVAEIKTSIPIGDINKRTQTFVYPDGRTQKVRSVDVLRDNWVQGQINQIKKKLFHNVVLSLYVLIGTFLLTVGFWIWRGRSRAEKEVLSGTLVVEGHVLDKLVKKKNEASDLTLAGVSLVKNKELQHTFIVGTTGAGKTNCIHEILQQIRTKRQKAVVVDVTGVFVEKYYRPGIDKILNPLDARSEKWNLWADCKENYHFDALADAFLPSKTQDEFWNSSAKSLFVATVRNLQETGDPSMVEFLNYSIFSPLSEVQEFYEGTPAASFMNEKADKTAIGVRATLAANVKCLELLEETDDSFSIRDWVRADRDEWLFISSTPEMREALKPLLTVWTSIATKGLMSLDPSSDRRVWFVIDELPALKKLPDFHTMLAEARKYGGCVVAGTQDVSLLDEIYGYNLVKSIINLCSTKVIFRISGADVAERISKWLGSQEISESIQNISYGAHQMRDGVSLNDQRRERAAVNADKLMKLADLEGYLKLPGDYPVAHIKFKYHQIKSISSSLVHIENKKHMIQEFPLCKDL